MKRYKKLRPNLYSADLHYGKIDIRPDHYCSCFFIVQSTDDMEFIRDQGMQLLLAGCRHFDFSGDRRTIWQKGIEAAHGLVIAGNGGGKAICMNVWDTIEEFAVSLNKSISLRTIIPCDHFLLYDDIGGYKTVLDAIGVIDR